MFKFIEYLLLVNRDCGTLRTSRLNCGAYTIPVTSYWNSPTLGSLKMTKHLCVSKTKGMNNIFKLVI